MHNIKLWRNGGWKNFDILLGNTALNFEISKYFGKSPPQELLDKMINVCHVPKFNVARFLEKIEYKEGPLFCGITNDIVNNFKEEYGITAYLAPVGTDATKFYPTRTIKKIKRIGFITRKIGDSKAIQEWVDIKRPEMFQEICRRTNSEPVEICNKPFTDYKDLYKDIDLLIYCSRFEGVATGICEAASCGIPVISTYVGNAKNIESIKTFESIEEACDIIESFNRHPRLLEKYISSLTKEVREKWNWEHLCKKFWVPIFEKKLESKKEKTTTPFEEELDKLLKELL
jgi:glycosyltransferase involved in cell wall biosynthesis